MNNRERQFVNKLKDFNVRGTAQAKRLLNKWKETRSKLSLDLAISMYQNVRRNERLINVYTKGE